MRLGPVLSILGFCSLVLARASPQYSNNDGGNDGRGHGRDGGDDNSLAASPSASATAASPSASSSTASSALIGLNGDTVCTDLMCIGGLVNGTTVQYTLQSLGSATLGWMAMGFGGTMANSPMVIMWPNSDGSITLSQRKASREVMPVVDSSPPGVATQQPAMSSLTGSNPKLVYTIAVNSDTQQSNIIWAFGSSSPSSSAVDATLLQHIESGPTKLDLTKTLANGSKDPTNPISTIGTSGSSNPNSPGSSAPTTSIPLQPYQKKIVAHAVLCVVGFLGLLPAGALLARYLRTYNPVWFQGHCIFQLALAGPIIIIGVALGICAVEESGTPHLSDDHMSWGIAIFVLYFAQVSLGAVIHYIKPKSFTTHRRRPAQNYLHAVFGLLIIALALYQVRTGFRTEWPLRTGRGSVGNGANIIWYIWVVLLPVLYFAGLVFLRRQFRQERGVKPTADDESDRNAINMHHQGRYHDEPDQ